jgi:hypothetical protein
MNDEERAKVVAELTADPAKVKADAFAEWKKEHPNGTEADFENEWGVVEAVLGL